MHEPKGNEERERKGTSSRRHPQQQQRASIRRREPETQTEIALKSEGTEIKNHISITLKKTSRGLLTCSMQGTHSQPETCSDHKNGTELAAHSRAPRASPAR